MVHFAPIFMMLYENNLSIVHKLFAKIELLEWIKQNKKCNIDMISELESIYPFFPLTSKGIALSKTFYIFPGG